jgi:hypothetical protein
LYNYILPDPARLPNSALRLQAPSRHCVLYSPNPSAIRKTATMRRASAAESKGHSRTYSISTVSSISLISCTARHSPRTTAGRKCRRHGESRGTRGRSGIRRLKALSTMAPQTTLGMVASWHTTTRSSWSALPAVPAQERAICSSDVRRPSSAAAVGQVEQFNASRLLAVE